MAAKKAQKKKVKKPEPVVEESESEMEVEENVPEEEEESSEEESAGGDDEDMNDDSEEDDEDDNGPVTIKPVASATGEQCTFDLRNLLALNSHQVETAKLYKKKGRNEGEDGITIPGEKLQVIINEDHLLEKATDGCTQLIHALWQLPTERSDTGPLVVLPSYSETLLPRQLVSCLKLRTRH